MKVIGLCGGSGSGKGTACKIFSELGIPTIDTDAIYHELTNQRTECLEALISEFGKDIITDNYALNRKKLASIVFSGENSAQRLEMLNKIAHKYILDEARRRIEGYRHNQAKAVIVDAPVLFESGFNKECDIILCVIARGDIRLERITSRDGISEEAAKQRIASQMADEELISRSDIVIRNNSDVDSLREQIINVTKHLID